MDESFKTGIKICWLIFMAYWLVSSIGTKKTAQHESLPKRLFFYWFPLIFAFYLLGPGDWFGHGWLRENFVPHDNIVGGIALALAVAGLLLCIWSRYLLGRNWSVSVELKQDHQLITSGPYRYVRHPIYSGLLLLFSGNALMVGDYRAILAVAIVWLSFWRKLRMEEKWLGAHFGPAYADYRRSTKALIPFIA